MSHVHAYNNAHARTHNKTT